MRSNRSMTRVLIGFAVAASLALAVPVSANAAPTAEPAQAVGVQPSAQEFFWEWSDGVDSKIRTFRKSKYQVQENLPLLEVTAEPARPQQYIKLQYKENGTWKREDAATTNAKGIARLELNPYCNGGKWCNGTFKYRLLVNGLYTMFTITYAN